MEGYEKKLQFVMLSPDFNPTEMVAGPIHQYHWAETVLLGGMG